MIETCVCCSKTADEVEHLIAISDNEIYLCNECSYAIQDAFLEAEATELSELTTISEPEKVKLLPSTIKSLLDKSVVGQEDAKKVLAVEIYNHYKRISNLDKGIQKSNVILKGNSGTGKTLLVKTLAKILDIPIAIVDTSNITESGYIGNSVESILEQLVAVSDGDIKKAECGIIMLDEFCKLASRSGNANNEKDPAGTGVQENLLKILEGTVIAIDIPGARSQQYIDTTNILFVAAGTFQGIEKLIEKRQTKDSISIGFSANINKPIDMKLSIEEDDIIQFGFISEILGRFPIVVELNDLTKEDYRRILTDPENSITSQYQKLMELDNIHLIFSDEYLDSVSEKVTKTKLGARALRRIIDSDLRDIIFSINDDTFGSTITI